MNVPSLSWSTEVNRLTSTSKPKGEASLCLHIGAEVARGLDVISRRGLVHRDIKPTNVLVDKKGNVRICDLDMSLAVTSTDSLTRTRELLGTLPYMSPEQVWCRRLDASSDVWSLGVLLYELGTGTLPFGPDKKTKVVAVLDRIRKAAPASPRWHNWKFSRQLSIATLACLEQIPGDGPTSKDLAEDLDRVSQGLPLLHILPQSIWQRIRRRVRSSRNLERNSHRRSMSRRGDRPRSRPRRWGFGRRRKGSENRCRKREGVSREG